MLKMICRTESKDKIDKIIKMDKTLGKYKICKSYLKFCNSSFMLGADRRLKDKINYAGLKLLA